MTEKTLWRIPKLPRAEWTNASREVCAFWGEPNAWEEGSKTNIIMATPTGTRKTAPCWPPSMNCSTPTIFPTQSGPRWRKRGFDN